MKMIYVVGGGTGEYSDRTEWIVAAFTDKAMGQEMVLRCEKFAPKEGMDYMAREKAKNPYDPNMRSDYTGTTYYLMEVPLLDAVPAVES